MSYQKLTQEEKQARLEQRRKDRRPKANLEEIERQKNLPEVKTLTITIEWKKSRTWGSNPHAQAKVEYYQHKNNFGGKFELSPVFTCSGCGYDKESTVIADIFNKYLVYKLYQKREWKENHHGGEKNYPYGVYYYDGSHGEVHEKGYISKPTFNGGVGTNCYFDISKFIGGELKKIASGSTFDVYEYTDKETFAPKINPEADEISPEDLEAASDYYDQLAR